ncbi:PREDICTED: uncharacterized protein LOC105366311, partial [Ceratosolen solmsi marchali]|uniref:Uncharacterized protein LOC105366311 n=1 Tax=Ceratosolen solmsi marchali TaxID=326594 RepID=A0AAJ6YRS5_9HYME
HSTEVNENEPRKDCEDILARGTVNPFYSKFDFLRASTNPFIVFFLRLYSKKPRENVTKIARVAGKRWQGMSSEQRLKYVEIAMAEKRRRDRQNRRMRKRKYRRTRRFRNSSLEKSKDIKMIKRSRKQGSKEENY